jgi:acyl-coenzyme A synthetase/AMP-(fatty) acid ligase
VGFNEIQAPAFLSLYGIDRMLASTAQLSKLLRTTQGNAISIPNLKTLVVGGGYVSPQLARRAQAAICRNVISLYGSTEVGVVATAPADVIIKNPGAVGYVVPGVRVETIKENGDAAEPNEECILRIHVAGAPSQYLNDKEATRVAFRDGWFYPGDTGRVASDGLLFLSGRQSDRLNAGGVKVAPGVIEDAILEWPGVLDVAAFEYLNEDDISQIAIAIVADGKLDQVGLKEFCAQRLRECTPKRLILVKEIPRNESGKIDRERLQRLAANLFHPKTGAGA